MIEKGDLILFKDILIQTDYASIEEEIFSIYPNEQKFKKLYADAYIRLQQLTPSKRENIVITIEKQSKAFDDSKVELWNVFGLDIDTEEVVALECLGWNRWLSFYVNKNALQEMGEENYIAHCLYRMTITTKRSKTPKIR